MEAALPRVSSSDSGFASVLIQLFTMRGGIGTAAAPEETMKELIARLRHKCRSGGSSAQQMQFYLRSRRIDSVETVRDLRCDGVLDPIGADYSAGFRILLDKHQSAERLRFTISHEICHTFFYELVPEIKFSPHAVDLTEERLCNFGAAELLMPTTAVQRAARPLAMCLESLNRLAEEFSVSLTAMFLRLRSLRLWNCQLSEWHRMSNGTFALEYFYGGKSQPWEWHDESILRTAWESNGGTFGHTFVRYEDHQGIRYYKPTRFEVRRLGGRMVALWGAEIERPLRLYPLFDGGSPPIHVRRRSGRAQQRRHSKLAFGERK